MVWFRDLIFDDWNEARIARHGVKSDEVIEAVRDAAFMTRRRREIYQWYGVYYFVTAREATREEQRRYRRQ